MGARIASALSATHGGMDMMSRGRTRSTVATTLCAVATTAAWAANLNSLDNPPGSGYKGDALNERVQIVKSP